MFVKRTVFDREVDSIMNCLRQERLDREKTEGYLRDQVRLLLNHFELDTGLVSERRILIKKR